MSSFFSIPKSQKGQGLFIYVMFLLFVVMVVIVVVRLFHAGDGGFSGNFAADYRYLTDPANGCSVNYIYGTNAGCDRIVDRMQTCRNGGTGAYCEEYFAAFPQ